GLVLADDLATSLIRRLRVIVVVADVIRAHRPMIVGVGLAVGNEVELLEGFAPAGVEDPNEQFILLWIITGRFGKWYSIVGMICQAHAEAICLYFLVALPIFARRLGADAWQHSALGGAGNDIRADLLFHRAEMMAVMQHARLDAVPFLAVDACRLAS